jgi:N-acetylglutamate synthase-like GNAT family acetyltransferase
MPLSSVTIRRATLEDIETLRGLWRECRLPEYDLERRFTEFQLAVDPHGWIMACLGLRFSGAHGQVHSLAVRRADLEADLIAALWERAMTLAHQHGAQRLWTQEHGEFWSSNGFHAATQPELGELPPLFGRRGERWLTLKIRDEPLKVIAAEEQLAAYLELERLRMDRLVRRGQFIKLLATAVAAVLFVLALAALLLLLRRRRTPVEPE